MLELNELEIGNVIAHKIGVKGRNEQCTFSELLTPTTPELKAHLKHYSQLAFAKEELSFKFTHHEDLNLNELYSYALKYFKGELDLTQFSLKAGKHLYECSVHPHIRKGELLALDVNNIIIEGEPVDGIILFKVERKSTFVKVIPGSTNFNLEVAKGIDIKRVDKACLIANSEADSGFRVFSVDLNNYDAQYWFDDFLQLKMDDNEGFYTQHTLQMVQQFTNEVLRENSDPVAQKKILENTKNYFEENESFSTAAFTEAVLQTPEYAQQFESYKKQYEEDHGVEELPEFKIVKQVAKKESKKYKSQIKLDNKVVINLDALSATDAENVVEKGYDEAKGMSYYKIYFSNEQ